MNENKLDELFTLLGVGWWHWIHYVMHIFCYAFPAPHSLGGAFLAPDVDYFCVPTAPAVLVTEFDDATRYEIYREDSGNSSLLNQCLYSTKNLETGYTIEEACTKWIFDNSTFVSTVTSEYQLTCDRAYLRAAYQSLIMVGMFFGAAASGFVADKYGRKKTMVMGFTAYVIATNASCWVPDLTTIMFFRVFIGFTTHFYCTTSFTLVVEITKPCWRPIAGGLATLPWSFGFIAWSVVAYFIREWRWLQFAVSIPGVLVLPLFWFTDESLRWLLLTGHSDEGLKVIKRVARLNKKTLPSDQELMRFLQDDRAQEEELEHCRKPKGIKEILSEILEGVFILVRTPQLRRITLAFYVAYLLVNMVYFGLSLSGGNLSDNPYIFMLFSGLMEVPGFSLTAPIAARFGRRIPCLVSFAVSGVALLAIAPIPNGYGWVIMILAMVGKLAIASAYSVLNLYLNELFPTEVRSRGFSTSFMMARIGSIISPFITELLGDVYPWAPIVIFGVSSLIVCVVIFPLPETKGVPLPDTVAEFEERHAPTKTSLRLPVPTTEKTSDEECGQEL